MKSWMGKWIMFVALGHTVTGIVLFGAVYADIILNGLYDSVVKSEQTALAVWFLFFGFLLFVFGMLLAAMEKSAASPIPRHVGVALLLLTTLGVVLMPVSGFWLMLPVVFAILFKQPRIYSG